MPRALPETAQARLEQVLADLELAIAAANRLPPVLHAESSPGGGFFGSFENRAAPKRLEVVLAAAANVVQIIAALPWSAADQRHAITVWHHQVQQQGRIDRARFEAERQQEEWWLDFQADQAAREPRVPVPNPSKKPRRVSFAKQLKAAMTARRMSTGDLAAATQINERSIRFYRAGRVPSRPDVVAQLERALAITFRNFPEHKTQANVATRQHRKTRRNTRKNTKTTR
jgi:ribosome-binding protein aMBF1 (putative translation factor)